MKNNSVNCVVDFSAAKMFKMGFWAGAGMLIGKAVVIALFGKTAITAATMAGKKGVKNGANKIFDELKAAVEKKANETEPETLKQMTDEVIKFEKKLEEATKDIETKGK